jgi:hypothetical protein
MYETVSVRAIEGLKELTFAALCRNPSFCSDFMKGNYSCDLKNQKTYSCGFLLESNLQSVTSYRKQKTSCDCHFKGVKELTLAGAAVC